MTRDPHRPASGPGGMLIGVAGVLGIVCCAGPPLLAASALAGLGIALSQLGVILVVAAVAVAAAGWLARRRRHCASCQERPAPPRPAGSQQESASTGLP